MALHISVGRQRLYRAIGAVYIDMARARRKEKRPKTQIKMGQDAKKFWSRPKEKIMSNEKKMRNTYKVYFRSIQILDGWKKDIKDIFLLSTHTYTEKQAISWAKKLESEKPNGGYKEYQGGDETCYIRQYFMAIQVPQPKPVMAPPPQPKPVKKDKTTKKSQNDIYQMTLKDYGV